MIEKDAFDEDIFIVHCDACGDEDDVDSGGDWSAMLATIKASGWTMRKIDDEWHHHCPDCSAACVRFE